MTADAMRDNTGKRNEVCYCMCESVYGGAERGRCICMSTHACVGWRHKVHVGRALCSRKIGGTGSTQQWRVRNVH